jgi:hypothetical protein
MIELPKQDVPAPHEPGDAESAEYRSVSALAVISLIVGSLGFAVLFEPIAWVLAAVGLMLAAVAWFRIERSEGALVGRKVAIAAILVSDVFLVAAPIEAWRYHCRVEAEAVEFAERWFDVLREHDGEMAYLLTLRPEYRRRMVETGDPTVDERYQGNLEFYLGQPIIKKLLSLGDRAKPHLESTVAYERLDDTDYVGLRYRVDDSGPNPQPSFDVAIALQRIRRPPGKDAPFGRIGRASWLIIKAGEPADDDEHDESEHGD